MNFCIVLTLFFWVVSAFAANPADSIENYPLVLDKRNFKESNGGKSTKPQGITLFTQSECLLIGEKFLDTLDIADEKCPWRYMVTMNCKKGSTDDLISIVEKLATNLLPQTQLH